MSINSEITNHKPQVTIQGPAPLEAAGRSVSNMTPLTGFTLIEALLAIGVGMIVLISAYSSLRVGWLSYLRLNSQSQVYQDLRGSLSAFARDLRNSFIFGASDDYSITFSGSSKEMSFASLTVLRNDDGEAYVCPAKVFYKIEGANLLRAYLKDEDILNQSLSPEYEVLLSNISVAGFSYSAQPEKSSQADQLSWKDSFEDVSSLPQAVRLSLTQKVDGSKDIVCAKSVVLNGSYPPEE